MSGSPSAARWAVSSETSKSSSHPGRAPPLAQLQAGTPGRLREHPIYFARRTNYGHIGLTMHMLAMDGP